MAVDWDYVVEGNRDALKRILAMMVAMVAAGAAAVTGEVVTGRWPARRCRAISIAPCSPSCTRPNRRRGG